MTAAHYIALLLLSTAAEGSREHFEIVEQNSVGIWSALELLGLVQDTGSATRWRLSERGRALVEHILALPLPEPVNTWRMPGEQSSIRMTATEVAARQDVPVSMAAGMILRPGPLEFVEQPWAFAAKPATLQPADDGPPPPKPAPPKPIPGITPAEDPEARRAQALELINRGFGTSEIAETLEMGRAEVEVIFFGSST